MFNWVSDTPLIVNLISRRNNYLYFVDSIVIQNATFKLKHWKIDLALFLFFSLFFIVLLQTETDVLCKYSEHVKLSFRILHVPVSFFRDLLELGLRESLNDKILREPNILRLGSSHLSKYEAKISSILTHFSPLLRFI